jgi:hypothetical protein
MWFVEEGGGGGGCGLRDQISPFEGCREQSWAQWWSWSVLRRGRGKNNRVSHLFIPFIQFRSFLLSFLSHFLFLLFPSL